MSSVEDVPEISDELRLRAASKALLYIRGIMRNSLRNKDNVGLCDCFDYLLYIHGELDQLLPKISAEDEQIVIAECTNRLVQSNLAKAEDFREEQEVKA